MARTLIDAGCDALLHAAVEDVRSCVDMQSHSLRVGGWSAIVHTLRVAASAAPPDLLERLAPGVTREALDRRLIEIRLLISRAGGDRLLELELQRSRRPRPI